MVNFLKYCKERKLAENWLVRKRENLTRDRILTSTCKLLVVIALRLLFCCCGKQCTLEERRNKDRTPCLMCGIRLCILWMQKYTVFAHLICFALFILLHILLFISLFYLYICSCVVLLLYNFILHCPLSGPDLICISLLIIPCIIYYVTNKQTLNLERCAFEMAFSVSI